MTRDEVFKKLEEHVLYLQRTIPPDDIYLFAEQTFVAAVFFLQYIDAKDNKPEHFDEFFEIYKINILKFLELQHNKVKDVKLELGLVWEEKEYFEKLEKEIKKRVFTSAVYGMFFTSEDCICGTNRFYPWMGKFRCANCGNEYDGEKCIS